MPVYTSKLVLDSIILPDPNANDVDTSDFCCEELSNLVIFLDQTGFGRIRKDRLIEIDLNVMSGTSFWVTDCGNRRKVIFKARPFCSTKFERKRKEGY